MKVILVCSVYKIGEVDKSIDFLDPTVAKSDSKNDIFLDEYDVVIVITGDLFEDRTSSSSSSYQPLLDSHKKIRAEVTRRHREIHNALKKGSHICILLNDIYDPLLTSILSELSLQLSSKHATSNIKIKKPEFQAFLSRYGTCLGIFKSMVGRAPSNSIHVICSIPEYTQGEPYESIVGLTKKLHPGMITFLPFFISGSQRLKSEDISNLIQSLQTHEKTIAAAPPVWINELKLEKEKRIEKELSDLRTKVNQKESLLSDLMNKKSILWLKGDELRDACMDLLKYRNNHRER